MPSEAESPAIRSSRGHLIAVRPIHVSMAECLNIGERARLPSVVEKILLDHRWDGG
jgi:hypothetical protein